MTNTRGQSASAKREQDCINAIEPVEELEAMEGTAAMAVLREMGEMLERILRDAIRVPRVDGQEPEVLAAEVERVGMAAMLRT
jgi:hypothetical protein